MSFADSKEGHESTQSASAGFGGEGDTYRVLQKQVVEGDIMEDAALFPQAQGIPHNAPPASNIVTVPSVQ